MKVFTKICLILAGILAALGIAFCIVAVGLGVRSEDLKEATLYWDEMKNSFVSEHIGEEHFEQSYKNIKNLDIDLGAGKMVVKKGDGDQIRVRADNIKTSFVCEVKGKTLQIKNKHHYIIGLNLWGKDTVEQIVLEIPEGMVFDEVKLELGIGEIQAEALHCSDLEIECGVGRAAISGKITEACEITCGVGEVVLKLDNEEKEFNYLLDCDVGEITLGNHSYSGLDNSKEIDYDAEAKMKIDCGVGKVEVKFKK